MLVVEVLLVVAAAEVEDEVLVVGVLLVAVVEEVEVLV